MPPAQDLFSTEEAIKQQVFGEVLTDLAAEVKNITVWENPLKKYDEDGGQHPSPEQTEQLIRYIDAMVAQQHGTSFLLPSATNDTITTRWKYGRVNALYKFGCAACSSREKNKWYYICLECKTALLEDVATKVATARFNTYIQEAYDEENPTLQRQAKEQEENDSPDGVRSRSPMKKGVDHSQNSDTKISEDYFLHHKQRSKKI